MGRPEAEDHAPSWFRATARGLPDLPRLEEAVRADVCVIGGGYTGLSAALHLAERGLAVVLLEGRRVGWGASGRNGGQVGTGQRLDEPALERRYGREVARRLFELALEARSVVRERVGRHGIHCDLAPGQLVVAAKPSHYEELRRRAGRLAEVYGYPLQRPVPPEELGAMLGSHAFHGGCLDAGAFHLHPLNYAAGLARAARAAGARLYEQSMVHGWSRAGAMVVSTDGGTVHADRVVLACNAHLEGLEPAIAPRIMPLNSYMIATEPLGESGAAEFLRDNVCVHDTRFVVNYFRRTPDHRLLFAGGESYGRRHPADIAGFVRPYAERIFPRLRDVRFEYAWGGTLAVTRTRMPHLGTLGENRYYAQGYSGHGIAMATLAGKLIAEAIAGEPARLELLAREPPPAFPGGPLLRRPLLAAGMLWYALRDRL